MDSVDQNCMELLRIAEIWQCQLVVYMDCMCKHHAVNMNGHHKGRAQDIVDLSILWR
jgi:hypothetical protein